MSENLQCNLICKSETSEARSMIVRKQRVRSVIQRPTRDGEKRVCPRVHTHTLRNVPLQVTTLGVSLWEGTHFNFSLMYFKVVTLLSSFKNFHVCPEKRGNKYTQEPALGHVCRYSLLSFDSGILAKSRINTNPFT